MNLPLSLRVVAKSAKPTSRSDKTTHNIKLRSLVRCKYMLADATKRSLPTRQLLGYLNGVWDAVEARVFQ